MNKYLQRIERLRRQLLIEIAAASLDLIRSHPLIKLKDYRVGAYAYFDKPAYIYLKKGKFILENSEAAKLAGFPVNRPVSARVAAKHLLQPLSYEEAKRLTYKLVRKAKSLYKQ